MRSLSTKRRRRKRKPKATDEQVDEELARMAGEIQLEQFDKSEKEQEATNA